MGHASQTEVGVSPENTCNFIGLKINKIPNDSLQLARILLYNENTMRVGDQSTATGTGEPLDEGDDIVSDKVSADGSDGSDEADGNDPAKADGDDGTTTYLEGLATGNENAEASNGGTNDAVLADGEEIADDDVVVKYLTEDGEEISEDDVASAKEAAYTETATEDQKKLYQQILEDINAATTTREMQQALAQVEPEIPPPVEVVEEMAAATAEATEEEVIEEKKNEQKAAQSKVTQEQHDQLFLAANKRCNTLANQAALQGDVKLEKTIKEFQKTHIEKQCLEAETTEKKTAEKKSVFKKAADGFAMAKQDAGKTLASLTKSLRLNGDAAKMTASNRAAAAADTQADPLSDAEKAKLEAEQGGELVLGDHEPSAKEVANHKNLLAMRREAALQAARRNGTQTSSTELTAHENLETQVPHPEPQSIINTTLVAMVGKLIKADGTLFTKEDADAAADRMLAGASGMSEAPEQSRSERTRGALGLVHTKAPKAKKGKAQPKLDSDTTAVMGFGARLLAHEFSGTVAGKKTGEVKLFGNAKLADQSTTTEATKTFKGTPQEAAQQLAKTAGTASTRFDPDFSLEKSELPDVKEMQRRSETEAKA